MLREGRRPHMVARGEERLDVHGSGEPEATKRQRIAEKARKEPEFKFTSLYHLMNEELLRECFKRLMEKTLDKDKFIQYLKVFGVKKMEK